MDLPAPAGVQSLYGALHGVGEVLHIHAQYRLDFRQVVNGLPRHVQQLYVGPQPLRLDSLGMLQVVSPHLSQFFRVFTLLFALVGSNLLFLPLFLVILVLSRLLLKEIQRLVPYHSILGGLLLPCFQGQLSLLFL